MLTKGNVTIRLKTRFGPNWPGKRCGARTKNGGECQRPAVKKPVAARVMVAKARGRDQQLGGIR